VAAQLRHRDKVYCVIADNEEVVREHARRSGFPCDAISTVAARCPPVLDP